MGVMEDPGVSGLYRTILLTLCGNFNAFMDPLKSIDCEFKSQYIYDLMTLRGKTLLVTTIEKMPLSGTMTDENGKLIGTGLAFNLFHEIQKKLGFFYTIIPPDVNQIGNVTHGVIKQLHKKEVELAVMFFPMLKEYRKYVTFSQSLGEFDWVLLMKRPLASATGSGLLAPFEENVWYAILASVVIVGPVVFLLVSARRKLCADDQVANHRYPLPACVWFVYGALMKQGSTLSPISDSARIMFATWWIFITILTSFYTANLTAFLTLSQFTLTIKGPKEIESYKRSWLADNGGHTYEMINNADELQGLKKMVPQLGRFTDNHEEILPNVEKDIIYVTERRKATVMILENYLNKTFENKSESERCTFVLSKPFLAKPMAFAFAKTSELNVLLNPFLAQLVQGGIVDYLLNKPLPMTTICPLNLANSERKLRNGDLKTTYYVVGAGFGLAAIAFIFEFCYRRYKKSNLNGLSINSGDIAGHILGQNGKQKGTIPNAFLDGKKTSNSAFLFQYTN